MNAMIVGMADLGIGNFAAMAKMVNQLGGDARRMTSPSELRDASRVILPGVGAFDYAMSVVDQGGGVNLSSACSRRAAGPFSEPASVCNCSWIPARRAVAPVSVGCGVCTRFAPEPGSGLKVPHMGWNQVTPTQPSPLFPSGGAEGDGERFTSCTPTMSNALIPLTSGQPQIMALTSRRQSGATT